MQLSVIVISHNQRDELKRCLDSIIAQALPFEYEIIVSDDRSTDGTLQLAQQYAEAYPVCRMEEGICRPLITAYACNSDECNPANNSQRSGYNRCNAYPHATGKYIAHVDADDYFRPGADVYRRQVEALEKHPECALAMSRCLYVTFKDNEVLTSPWIFGHELHEGDCFTASDFVRKGLFCLNQAFIQRRNPHENPVALYGSRYVDSIITFHHLKFGGVVFVEACDYMYVQNQESVTGTIWDSENQDKTVLWCLGLYIPALIPVWSKDCFMGRMYSDIRQVVKLAIAGYKLSPKAYRGLAGMHLFIYDCFGRGITTADKIRLHLTDFWMKLMKVTGWESAFAIKILRKLLFA